MHFIPQFFKVHFHHFYEILNYLLCINHTYLHPCMHRFYPQNIHYQYVNYLQNQYFCSMQNLKILSINHLYPVGPFAKYGGSIGYCWVIILHYLDLRLDNFLEGKFLVILYYFLNWNQYLLSNNLSCSRQKRNISWHFVYQQYFL